MRRKRRKCAVSGAICGFKDYLINPVLYCNHSKRYDTSKQMKGDINVNKNTFINRLAEKASITQEQSRTVVETIEEHNLFSKSEKPEIVEDIAKQLGCSEDDANRYFADASQIVSSEIKSQTVKWIAGTAVIVIAGIIVFRLKKK